MGAKAALGGISIVSGGARGVDETAMLGAINSGGAVIGITADSLLKAATSAKWRKGLMVSLPGYPFARKRHWVTDIPQDPASASALVVDVP